MGNKVTTYERHMDPTWPLAARLEWLVADFMGDTANDGEGPWNAYELTAKLMLEVDRTVAVVAEQTEQHAYASDALRNLRREVDREVGDWPDYADAPVRGLKDA
jgi:hypothetical protein